MTVITRSPGQVPFVFGESEASFSIKVSLGLHHESGCRRRTEVTWWSLLLVRNPRVARDSSEAQSTEVIGIEREDVSHVSLLGEDATQMIDERDFLIVVLFELLTGTREAVLVYIGTRCYSDRSPRRMAVRAVSTASWPTR